MPLSRYLVRNEYGLADPDLYKAAEKDDPEALLEGVAMAGLVGVLRQLGDLAEFAAEMFHDLHEEVMATAARGHALIARVQQLEAELPSAENILLSQTTHIPFLYNSGIDWHPNIRMDENLVTEGDMPRFVMDSYEECRGPPRLFLLDKFDVAGAGACLKRYTDPSFCKVESADFNINNSEGQREKRTRKFKRRGSMWRNGDTPELFPSSHAKLHQLLLEERIETGANDPERRVKLKKRPLDGFTREDRLKSYMQKFVDTCSSDTKAVREISLDLVPVNVPPYNDNCHSGLEIVKYDTFSPSPEPFYKDKATYSSFNTPEVVKPSLSEFNEVTDGRVEEISGSNNGADADILTDVSDEDLAKSGGSVGDYNADDIASEIDNYVDALATLESETETDSDTRTRSHGWSLNGAEKMIDSDGNEDKRQQNLFLDHHSRGDSTISDDCSLPKKETDIYSTSDNVSNSAEDATAKSSAVGPINSLAGENSVTREAQVNSIKEPVASDITEYMGIVNAEFKELPWISINALSALTETDAGIEQTDQESTGQAVANAVLDYDQSMPLGISRLDEVADASSVSSSDNSSHPQPEFCRNGQLTSLSETKSTSVSSPANSINDLEQPVEATSDALISSVSVLDFPEPVSAPSEDNDMSQINEKSSDDESKHDDLESVGQLVSLATDADRTVEPRVSTPADCEDSCVPSAEPLCFGYIESTEQLGFNSSENSYSHSGDESSDWIVHKPNVDKTNMISDDSCNADIPVNASQVNSPSNQVQDVPGGSLHFDSLTIGKMEASSEADNADKFESFDDCIDRYQDVSEPAPVSISDVHLVYDTGEPVEAEGDTISSVDTTHEKDAEAAAVSSQTAPAEYPCTEQLPEVKDDLGGFTDSVETKGSSSSYDCLEVENTETKRQMISSTGYEGGDLQNPVSCGRDEFLTSNLIASDTSSVVLRSADIVGEFCLEDGQTSVCPTSHEEASLSSVISEKMIEMQGVEITSQPLEYAEQILHPEDGENEKCNNPVSVSEDGEITSQPLEDAEQILLPVEPQGSLKFENPGQNMNLSQATPPPLLGISPNPTHVAPGDMPPLPPLPPMQWRLGRNQKASLAFGGLMQNPSGTPQSSQEPGTSDNAAGLRYQSSSSGEGANVQHAAQYPGGYLQEPTTHSLHSKNMSHEDAQQHTVTIDHGHDPQPFIVSQNSQLDNLSFEPSKSRSMNDDAISCTPALFEQVIQKETNVANDQFERFFFPAEQEAAGVDDEQLEYNTDIATTSAQFGPLMPMQYGNQLSHGFSDPEAQGIWSADIFSARKPENGNGSLQKKIQRPSNPLIDAVVAVDKSKLRKVREIVKPQDKPEAATREQHLPQLRKVGNRVKPQEKPEGATREQHLPQLRKVGNRVKPQDKPEGETREQNLPQLRKVGQREKPRDAVKAEGSSQNFPQLRKTVERVKPREAELSAQLVPQLRNVDKRIKSEDEPKAAQDEPQGLLPLRDVGGNPKPQDESQAENKDWLEQIRNQSFNLKRAATSRPNIQGRQTNLKVAAILEKASMIRQAMAGNDDDSDGWSDC